MNAGDMIFFSLISRETELDKKILSALLKGHDMTMYQKLYLAMVWDRVDIAEEKILAAGSENKYYICSEKTKSTFG